MHKTTTEHLQESLTSLLTAQAKLTEAISLDFSSWYYTDPRDLGIGDSPGFWPNAGPKDALALLRRQQRGELIPAFLNEPQLAWLRKRIRQTVVNSEVALNALNLHDVYAIGTGFEYEAIAKKPEFEPYVEDVQTVVDAFCEYNSMSERESEAQARIDVDGEAFLRLFDTGDPLLSVRFIEPDFVRSPNGDSTQDSFGIRTKPNDVEAVLGYWIDEGASNDSGPDLVFVEADEVLHIKHHETPSTSKRGLSAFFAIEPTLRAAEDLLMSTVTMAKSRAKVAWVQKLQNATADVVDALIAQQTAVTGTDPRTQQTVNMEAYRYGSILRIPASMDLEFPNANISASDHAGVMAMVLRMIACRFSMPEYMLSSDASNGNYSNVLVAESPFVKSMAKVQDRLGKVLARNKLPGPKQALIWRQIRHCISIGLLPPEVLRGIEIHATGASLTVRDLDKEAKTNQIYHDLGVKSVGTIREEQNLDSEKEDANFAKERASMPAPPQSLDPTNPSVTLPLPRMPVPPAGRQESDETRTADRSLALRGQGRD